MVKIFTAHPITRLKNTSHKKDSSEIGSLCAYPRMTTPTEIHKVRWADVILNRAPAHYKNEYKVANNKCNRNNQ